MSNNAADAAYRTHAGLDEATDAELERDPIIAVTGEDIPANEKTEGMEPEPPHDPPAEPVDVNDVPNPPQTEESVENTLPEDENLTQLSEVQIPGTEIGETVEPGVDETVAL